MILQERHKVYLIDDHIVVRDGVRRNLENSGRYDVVGESKCLESALADTAFDRAHAVVMDLNLPGVSGLAAVERLRRCRRDLPIVVFTMQREDTFAISLLRAGANAFLSKDRDPFELLKALDKAVTGGRYVTEKIALEMFNAGKHMEHEPHASLTPRERQVFELIVAGKSQTQLAKSLYVSETTIGTHVTRIKRKLGVDSTVDLLRYAFRHGLAA